MITHCRSVGRLGKIKRLWSGSCLASESGQGASNTKSSCLLLVSSLQVGTIAKGSLLLADALGFVDRLTRRLQNTSNKTRRATRR